MSTVNLHIQRAIHEAINVQVSPQIQITIRQVQNTNGGTKNVRNERPEQRSRDMANEQVNGPSLLHKDTLQDNRCGECRYTE